MEEYLNNTILPIFNKLYLRKAHNPEALKKNMEEKIFATFYLNFQTSNNLLNEKTLNETLRDINAIKKPDVIIAYSFVLNNENNLDVKIYCVRM